MTDLDVTWVVASLFLELVGFVFWLQRRRAAKFVDSFDGDRELVAEQGVWREFPCVTGIRTYRG